MCLELLVWVGGGLLKRFLDFFGNEPSLGRKSLILHMPCFLLLFALKVNILEASPLFLSAKMWIFFFLSIIKVNTYSLLLYYCVIRESCIIHHVLTKTAIICFLVAKGLTNSQLFK